MIGDRGDDDGFPSEPSVCYRVRTLNGQTESIRLDVHDLTVGALQIAVEYQFNVPADLQRLFFAGRELSPPLQLLSHFRIPPNAIIHLVPRIHPKSPSSERAANKGPAVVRSPSSPSSPSSSVAPSASLGSINNQLGDEAGHGGHFNLDHTLEVYRCALVLMFCSTIDWLYVMIWSLYNPFMIPAVTAPICGYLAARNCSWKLMPVYVVGLLAHIGYRIYTIVSWDPLLAKATSACFICFNLTVAIFACWFTHCLKTLDHYESITLRAWFASNRNTGYQAVPDGLHVQRMYQGYRPQPV
eukprot:TRINITY_DN21563_c0_g1_i1.p1 TRINITY_DN21563_c0_g1~~TRINITY_DN21563_c0_g1_i1.p1  ORF type:complete len:299 (+),score=45.30 TRINITY_DN21563_c0_g1_i1:76-972(+)